MYRCKIRFNSKIVELKVAVVDAVRAAFVVVLESWFRLTSDRPRTLPSNITRIVLSIAVCFFLAMPLEALVAASPAPPANALDPNRRLSQYGHTAWRMQDGVFPGSPHAVAQTTDGYLWIGTESGLVRFDGARFVSWTPPNGEPFKEIVYKLLGAQDGSLWIGTERGLYRWDHKELRLYGGTRARIESILEDHIGRTWVARGRIGDAMGPVCLVAEKDLQCYGKQDGIGFPVSVALAEDYLGGFWIASPTATCHWDMHSCSVVAFPGVTGDNAPSITGLLTNAGGSVLAVAQDIWQLGKRGWTRYLARGVGFHPMDAELLLNGSGGDAWIGTARHGLIRLRGKEIEQLRQQRWSFWRLRRRRSI